MQRPDHILVLDDDLGTLALAQRRLTHAGFTVTACRTIAETEAKVADTAMGIDLVIADYALEDETESGLDLLRRLSTNKVNVPSVLMTGFVTEERILDALRSGVSDVIRKNEGYLELLPSVARRVLDTFRLQKDLLVAEESQRYYHQLSNAIPHLIYTVSVDGTLIYCNAQWTRFFDRTLESSLASSWIDVMVHAEDRKLTRDAFAKGLEERAFSVVHRLRAGDGELRWYSTRGTLMRLDMVGDTCLLTSTDIDQQYRAAQDNANLLESERLARSAAEAATRAKDEFIATVSHELRSPLNAVVGWTEVLMRDASLTDKQRAGLEVILRNGKAQAKMIDDLLDMSSVLAGRLRIDLQRVDLAEVIEMAVLTVQPAAHAKGIEMRYQRGPQCLVNGDPVRLQQVLWNLLVNAVKFTESGGFIAVELLAEPDEYVIVVQDSGRGITPEFLPHVFERFRQESNSSKAKGGGLGLGLAITRELIELHGGKVAVDSPGLQQGTRFTVRLPSAAKRPPGPKQKIAPTSEMGLRNVRVLVVEDDDDAREFIVAGLKSRGATVTSASSAREALSLFYAQRPEIVLSDLGLGEEDGHALIRAIRDYEKREHLAPTPAIALTALTQPEDRQRSIEAGFNVHLAKPVDSDELIRVMTSFADGSLTARVARQNVS